jgi:hypothetical protein
MSKPTRKPRRNKSPKRSGQPQTESQAADAITIAWTVSVNAVLVANVVVIAAGVYARFHPDAKAARALAAIMLIAAVLMGAVSLSLLPVAWRTTRLKPPQGYMAFAILVAVAPIIVLATLLLR